MAYLMTTDWVPLTKRELTDRFMTPTAYQKRYGFIYVDRDEEERASMNRYKKDSYYRYQEVIRTNGTNLFDHTPHPHVKKALPRRLDIDILSVLWEGPFCFSLIYFVYCPTFLSLISVSQLPTALP